MVSALRQVAGGGFGFGLTIILGCGGGEATKIVGRGMWVGSAGPAA
jgi:hypothetical protein